MKKTTLFSLCMALVLLADSAKAKEIYEHGPHVFHTKMTDELKNKIKTIKGC